MRLLKFRPFRGSSTTFVLSMVVEMTPSVDFSCSPSASTLIASATCPTLSRKVSEIAPATSSFSLSCNCLLKFGAITSTL